MATKENEKKSNVTKLREQASNKPSKELIKEGLDFLKLIDDRMESQKGTHMQKCKVIRDDKAHKMISLADRGLDTKALLAKHKANTLERKAREQRAKLNEDSQVMFDHINEQMALFTADEAPEAKAPAKDKVDAG